MLLPVGLVLALILAMIFPAPGLMLGGSHLAFVMIATIFLINGYQTHPRSMVPDRRLIGGGVISGLVSFGGGGLLALLASKWLGPSPISQGLLVMCVMAPTLSSVIVITNESGGNAVWATLLTMGLNLLGIFVIPPMLSYLFAGAETPLPAMKLLLDLVLSVLLPFCLGVLGRHLINRKPIRIISLTPTLLVILLSYVSFCGGREMVVQSGVSVMLKIAGISLAIHLLLLLAALVLTKLFRFAPDEQKAIAFLASQKTLPTAVGVLATMGSAAGPALLPCVLFHFSQILADSLIAGWWKRVGQSVPVAEAELKAS